MSAEGPRPERFLEPGEVVFAKEPERLKTLLGSCVAITFWHPRLKVGAMCHYLVPERPASESGPPNGKFGEDAIGMITRRFFLQGLEPDAFEVKIFGGSNMFPDLFPPETQAIGERNIEVGRRLLKAAGFHLQAEDLAGIGQRLVVFDLQSGEVWVRQGPGLSTPESPQGRTP